MLKKLASVKQVEVQAKVEAYLLNAATRSEESG
jgi:hypothetical protein